MILKPTMKLRWRRVDQPSFLNTDINIYGIRVLKRNNEYTSYFVLEQCFINEEGKKEWFKIEEENE